MLATSSQDTKAIALLVGWRPIRPASALVKIPHHDALQCIGGSVAVVIYGCAHEILASTSVIAEASDELKERITSNPLR